MSIKAVVKGIGGFLPNNVLTNSDLEKLVATTDEWIQTRTGIKQRYIAEPGVYTSDLASEAAKIALQDAKLDASEIGAIIVATTTPDYTFPSTAVKVQANIKASNAFAFDVQAVCAGFIYAITLAKSLIENGQAKNVLVIGAETMSKILNWDDRTTCVLFGDGAGAMVFSAEESSTRGILATKVFSDGSFIDILKTSGGTSIANGEKSYILMEGKEVFKHAVEKMSSSVNEVIELSGLNKNEIDWFIPHQANMRIMAGVAKKAGINDENIISTVENHANTSAASIPLAVYEAYKQGKLKPGQNIVFTAFGAGAAWGSTVVKL